MTFGPSEMALLMQGVQATIAVVILSTIGAGIVLGSLICCYHLIRARRQESQPDPPTFPIKANSGAFALETWSSLELEPFIKQVAQGLHRSRHSGSAYGRQFLRIFISRSLLFAIVLAVGGSAFYWHHASKGEAESSIAAPSVETARPPLPEEVRADWCRRNDPNRTAKSCIADQKPIGD